MLPALGLLVATSLVGRLFENDNGDKCRWILPTITRPVLIIHGDNDIFVPKQQSDYLLKSIPNSKLVLLHPIIVVNRFQNADQI